MAKIDIIQQQLQPVEQNMLDIYQIEIISMFNKLLNQEDILDFLNYLNSEGYSLPIENRDNAFIFIGCDKDYMNKYKHAYRHTEIHYMFDIYVIGYCKKMLTAWHTQNTAAPRFSWKIKLSKTQRGILTKILKIENKRQKNLRKQKLL